MSGALLIELYSRCRHLLFNRKAFGRALRCMQDPGATVKNSAAVTDSFARITVADKIYALVQSAIPIYDTWLVDVC